MATCGPCLGVLDRGRAGASAASTGARRRENYERRVRTAHPKLGGLILAVSDEPQSVRSWERGSIGEIQLGEQLEALQSTALIALHDRLIPGTRANIDHIVVGPAAIFVIDAKRYQGKIERRDRGWILARDWRLYVNGRDRTKLVEAMSRQVDAMREAVGETVCPVIPVLCFVDATWDFPFPTPLRFDDVRVMWPKELYKFVRSEGPTTSDEITRLAGAIAKKLPPAA